MYNKTSMILAGVSALLTALAACGGGQETSNTTSGSTDSMGGSAGGAGDTGGGSGTTTSSSSSTSTTGSTAPSGLHVGIVAVGSGPQHATDQHGYKALAGFSTAPDGSPGAFTEATVGPCVVRRYTTLPVKGAPIKQSAGTITIDGGVHTLSLSPDGNGKYAELDSSTEDLFSGGETITIKAAGDVVPAFSFSMIAPSGVDLTQPAEPPNKGPLPVDRTADLTFSWSGGGSGDVIAVLTDPSATRVTCTFASAPGKGTIPKAALASLAANGLGTFAIQAATTQEQTLGEWQLLALVVNSLKWNGVVDPQTLTYQAMN